LNDAIKEVGLKINAKKTRYILLPCHQKAGQNAIEITNRSFENVSVQIFGSNSNKSKFDSGGN
jgi:hypothetical protein